MKTDNTRIYSVVVIDDSREYRVSLLDLLAHIPGIRVAGTGADEKDAIGLCAEYAPDILLIDSGMPGFGAIATARVVKEQRPETYIVFMATLDASDFDMLHHLIPVDSIISKSDIKSSMLAIISELDSNATGHAP